MFKKLRCKHVYMQTSLTRYDPFSGGATKFICLECHQKKWIHTPNISYYFEQQRINDSIGIESKIRYVKDITTEKKASAD